MGKLRNKINLRLVNNSKKLEMDMKTNLHKTTKL